MLGARVVVVVDIVVVLGVDAGFQASGAESTLPPAMSPIMGEKSTFADHATCPHKINADITTTESR